MSRTEQLDRPIADGREFFAAALDPSYREDPYPVLHRFRRPEGPSMMADHLWLIARHADAATALRSPHCTTAEHHGVLFNHAANVRTVEETVLLFREAPDHNRLRGLVMRSFTPKTVERLRTRIESLVDRQLDDLAEHDGAAVDFVESFAHPLPVAVICELLGVPSSDAPLFGGWSSALAASLDPAFLRTPEADAAAFVAERELGAYLADLFARRLGHPGEDLISSLVVARRDDDALSDIELTQLVMFLLIAGHETTVNLLGNAVLALSERHDLWARLRRGDAANAADELVRFDSPVHMTQRVVLDDLQLGDVLVPAGDHLIILLGAANRDPSFAASPDMLDFDRDVRNHVGFGGGIHHCLGAALARTEADIALSRMARRFAHVELAGPVVRRPTFLLRGPSVLPVALTQ